MVPVEERCAGCRRAALGVTAERQKRLRRRRRDHHQTQADQIVVAPRPAGGRDEQGARDDDVPRPQQGRKRVRGTQSRDADAEKRRAAEQDERTERIATLDGRARCLQRPGDEDAQKPEDRQRMEHQKTDRIPASLMKRGEQDDGDRHGSDSLARHCAPPDPVALSPTRYCSLRG